MLRRLQSALAILPVDAIRLCVAAALSAFPWGYLAIVLPIYLSKVGLESAVIGQLFGISNIVSAVLLVVFGLMADRFGRKPFILAGLALPALSYAVFLGTTDQWLLMLAAGLGGVGVAGGLSGALSDSSFTALLAEKTGDTNRTLVFSFRSAILTGALTVGSLIAGLPERAQQAIGLAVMDSYRPLFAIALIASLLAVIVVWPVREGHVWRAGQAVARPGLLPRRSAAAIAKLSLVMGLIGLGAGFSIPLLSLWFYLQFKVSGDFLGPWFAASSALAMVGVNLIPKLAKRAGTAQTVVLTQGFAALSLGAMIFAPTASIAAALYLVRYCMINLSWPAQQSYIMGIVAPEERAAASSLTFAAWGLASSLSPTVGGRWLDQGLLPLPILASTTSYLLSIGVFYAFFSKVRLPEETRLRE
jgi:MFS family permease